MKEKIFQNVGKARNQYNIKAIKHNKRIFLKMVKSTDPVLGKHLFSSNQIVTTPAIERKDRVFPNHCIEREVAKVVIATKTAMADRRLWF